MSVEQIAALAAHHELVINPARLIHDYQLTSEAISKNRMLRIFQDLGFKARYVRFNWRKLRRMGAAYPALAILRDGSSMIFSGFDEDEITGEEHLVAVDPQMPAGQDPFVFFKRDELQKIWAGGLILVKPRVATAKSGEPFGLRWFVPEVIRQGRIFGEIILIALFMHLLALAVPLYFQTVVDKVLVHQAINTLNVLALGVGAIVMAEGLFRFLRDYLLTFAASKIDMRLATRTFTKLISLPLSFFERSFAGVITKHMQQTEEIREFLTGNMLEAVLDATALLVFITILFLYSPKLTWVVLGFSLAIALVIAVIISPFYRRLMALYAAEGERQAMLVENIHGMATVKSLALEPAQRKHWDQSAAHTVTTNFSVEKMSTVAESITRMLEQGMSVAVIWVGAQDVFAGALTVGGLVAFQMLAGNVSKPLIKLVELAHEYQKIHLSVRMLGEIMNRKSEGGGGSAALRPTLQGNIQFEQITFRYNSTDNPALRDLDFTIGAGEVIGLVGRSGSGKSTITRLIQGLYNPQAGIIRLDGLDIREMDLAHLRQSIGVVLQENFLFHGSVRRNISMTRPDADFEEVVAAAKMAGADEFVQYLPQGYDTILEENGANLSGGQRQRLAIARALLKQPGILIFDEATSALDPESEYIIQQNLEQIATGRTMILVAHRLSTLRNADRIIVLDKGAIETIGSHEELLQSSPTYSELWALQSRYSR